MSLRLLEPGLCALVVDFGRPRTRSLGVPCGGAADVSALVLANALVGNPGHAAALEVTLVGPVLQALEPTAVAFVGADFAIGSGRQKLSVNQSFTLQPGEEIHIGGARHGARAYLAVKEGFQTPVVLESRCSLEPLKRGLELPCVASTICRRLLHHRFAPDLVPALAGAWPASACTLRVLPGPEADWFPLGAEELVKAAGFAVRPESNRMGLRLAGQPLPVPPREMVSQPAVPGTLQVTREGQVILLGVDSQTIGGYPRIAHVISADMDLVGQLRPGERVVFRTVAFAEAERLGRDRREQLRRWCLRLREAAAW